METSSLVEGCELAQSLTAAGRLDEEEKQMKLWDEVEMNEK